MPSPGYLRCYRCDWKNLERAFSLLRRCFGMWSTSKGTSSDRLAESPLPHHYHDVHTHRYVRPCMMRTWKNASMLSTLASRTVSSQYKRGGVFHRGHWWARFDSTYDYEDNSNEFHGCPLVLWDDRLSRSDWSRTSCSSRGTFLPVDRSAGLEFSSVSEVPVVAASSCTFYSSIWKSANCLFSLVQLRAVPILSSCCC